MKKVKDAVKYTERVLFLSVGKFYAVGLFDGICIYVYGRGVGRSEVGINP